MPSKRDESPFRLRDWGISRGLRHRHQKPAAGCFRAQARSRSERFAEDRQLQPKAKIRAVRPALRSCKVRRSGIDATVRTIGGQGVLALNVRPADELQTVSNLEVHSGFTL
jgi:hypothetical protein